MTANDDEAFEKLAQQMLAEQAFETYVESTAQMLRMLQVVVDMASRVSMSARLYAEAAGASTVADGLYRDVFMHVWDKTVSNMYEIAKQHDALQTILEVLQQRSDGDDDDDV